VRIAERPWLAYAFALAYPAAWALLRYLLLCRSIAVGLVGIGCVCLLYLLFVFLVMPAAPWDSRRFKGCLLLVAVCCRLVLFDVPPETLSDDVYRYVWDGKVQWQGINPYRFAPAAEELSSLRESFHAKINHPFHQTIYPPVAQLVFALAYLISGSHLLGLRLIYLGCDLLAAWWVLQIIGKGTVSSFGFRASGLENQTSERTRSGLSPGLHLQREVEAPSQSAMVEDGFWGRMGARDGAVFLYLLSPLLLIETYVGMHVDVVGMAFLVGAYRYFVGRALVRGFTLLVAAVLVKYIALAAVPVFIALFIRDRWSAGAGGIATDLLRWGGWSLMVAAALFAPYLAAGGDLFKSLVDYSLFMDFNSPIHSIIVGSAGSFAPLVRSIVLMGLMGYILAGRGSTPVKISWAVMSFVLTGPAVFPWYLLYLVPFLALEWTLGGLALTTLPFLSYEVLIEFHASGVWTESHWVRTVGFLPVLVCVSLDIWRRRCIGDRR